MTLLSTSRAVGIVGLVLAGCHAGPVTPRSLVLAVDSSAYHRHGHAPIDIPFQIRNAGSTPAQIPQCDGRLAPLIDRLSRGVWRAWDSGFCNGGQASLLTLLPGVSAQGTVTIHEGGNFRLRIDVASEREGAPGQSTTSPAFDVW